MSNPSLSKRARRRASGALGAIALLAFAPSAGASAVSLGTSSAFAVLGGSTVTNTGPSVIGGDKTKAQAMVDRIRQVDPVEGINAQIQLAQREKQVVASGASNSRDNAVPPRPLRRFQVAPRQPRPRWKICWSRNPWRSLSWPNNRRDPGDPQVLQMHC